MGHDVLFEDILYVINDDNGVTLDKGRRDKKEYFPKPWEFNKDR